MEAITVSQLNRYIKSKLASDVNLRNVVIKGELSNFTNHIKTGHFYFSLKDDSASIRAIMFKGNAQRVKFTPEDGMNVIITGNIQVFERDGIYQLYCDSMEPDGIGALYLAFEQLKEKLSKEGLFAPEHKKPIPQMPKTIGVVTSKTGAALQDIINILSRRYPLGRLVLIPALVQGENAPKSIADGIIKAQSTDSIDVLIVGRGGGSAEDLWAFNDEQVARAIYDCAIPVISAVGHEVDFTISDFVADLRAPTPSAAAELCAPDCGELSLNLAKMQAALRANAVSSINIGLSRLKADYAKLSAASPENSLKLNEQELSRLSAKLATLAEHKLSMEEIRLRDSVSTMEALSPLKVLTRGYSITYQENHIAHSAKEIKEGDLIRSVLSDGEIVSITQQVTIKEL